MLGVLQDLRSRYEQLGVQDKGSVFNTDLMETVELGFLLDCADTLVTAVFDHDDREPPLLRTLRGSARPGTTANLRYRVWDDSGKSRETLTILDGKAQLGRVIVPLHADEYRQVYAAHWHVPAGLKRGERLFCAVATDANGNASKRSCSAITVT